MLLEQASVLTLLGMLGGLIVTVITATAFLVWRGRGVIESNRTLKNSVDELKISFNHHVLESNTKASVVNVLISDLRRAVDAMSENLKSNSHRVRRVEEQSDRTDLKVIEMDKRLAVLESQQA